MKYFTFGIGVLYLDDRKKYVINRSLNRLNTQTSL